MVEQVEYKSWIDRLREKIKTPEIFYWFKDQIDWSRYSIWIGKFYSVTPITNYNSVVEFLNLTANNAFEQIDKSKLYLRFYISKSTRINLLSDDDEYQINCFIVYDGTDFMTDIHTRLLSNFFHCYEFTQDMFGDEEYVDLLKHYLSGSSFYPNKIEINNIGY